jgi:hypothetical protein
MTELSMRASDDASHPSDETRRTARRERSLARGTSGAIYVEFLIAFLPFFVMVLGMTQSALMYMAHLVVQHSAVIAARASIVVLPDDPAKYSDSPVNTVATGNDSSSGGALDSILSFLGADGSSGAIPGFGGSGGGGGGGSSPDPSSPRSMYSHRNARMSAIVDAASIPLMSISPSMQQLAPQLFGQSDNMRDGIGSNNPLFRAATSLLYNKVGLAVTFPTSPGVNQYRNSFGRDDAVTTRVTYLFHCAIPIARQLMCDDPISLRFGVSPGDVLRIIHAVAGSSSPEAVAAAIESLRIMEERHRAMEPGVAELETAPWSLAMLATALTGARFTILRAEATLPNQGADYAYQTAGSAGTTTTEDAGTPDSGTCPAGFSGCCSYHMGIQGCATDGRLMCNDMTASPSCRCNSDGTRACP